MHPLTQAIVVFEQEAVRIKLDYRASLYVPGEINLQSIEQRDEQIERCLWAIDLLHKAYITSTGGKRRLMSQLVTI